MSIITALAGLFTPAANAIDKLVTSDAERMLLRNELAKIESQVTTKLIELDAEIIKSQAKLAEAAASIAAAEAKSESAFVRLYKPVIISCMFVLIALNAFGFLREPLPEIFIQVFGAAFGIVTLSPIASKTIGPMISKFGGKK